LIVAGGTYPITAIKNLSALVDLILSIEISFCDTIIG